MKLPGRTGKLGSLERSMRKQLAAAPMQRPLEPGTLMVPLEALRAGGAQPKPVEREADTDCRDELVEGQAASAPRVQEDRASATALHDDCMLLLASVAVEKRPPADWPWPWPALIWLPELDEERARSSCSASRYSAEADAAGAESGGFER